MVHTRAATGAIVFRSQPREEAVRISLLLGTVLLACQLTNPSWAQKSGAAREPGPNPPYPGEAHVTFQWSYSCEGRRACSFNCPGIGNASRVTALDVYLGTIPTGKEQSVVALFYNFSTEYEPRSNGFSVSSGNALLSCQVNGMKLDYSGPPKD